MTATALPPRDQVGFRPHALLVTADPDLQHFLSEGLLFGGFWTSTIASAIQALEVFRLRSFDLVLVDTALPGFGGIELVRRLRGRSDRAPVVARTDVPIVLVAGDPSEITDLDLTSVGVDHALVAPIELDDLVPLLHQIVAAWRSAHPDRPPADEAARGT